mmetsp:Transcript_33088/g.33691  ORF Transcript_33088/g.33691 Transcript_33088/m.33691 type:complete len:109 (-) Transcript_33088:106-432(-)
MKTKILEECNNVYTQLRLEVRHCNDDLNLTNTNVKEILGVRRERQNMLQEEERILLIMKEIEMREVSSVHLEWKRRRVHTLKLQKREASSLLQKLEKEHHFLTSRTHT